MKRLTIIVALLATTAFIVAVAESGFLSTFNNLYGTSGTLLDDCDTCHIQGQPFKNRNPYGVDVKTKLDQGSNIMEALQAIEGDDSDGDGDTNIVEITARTLPGDPDNTTPVDPSTWGKIKALYE